MKILIIGGTGFISRNIVKHLLNHNHEVTIFNRGKSPGFLRQNKNLRIIHGDRKNESDLKKVISNSTFDVVYDMVSYKPEESESSAKIFKGKIGRFIHCSTVSVYMISADVTCPITEDQDKNKLMEYFPNNPFGMDYGINKRKCETVLWNFHDEKYFPVHPEKVIPSFSCVRTDSN